MVYISKQGGSIVLVLKKLVGIVALLLLTEELIVPALREC